MIQEFDVGNEAYIIESNRIIRKCTIVRKSGDLYIIRFENGGGIQVRGHRLFMSVEDAEKKIGLQKNKRTDQRGGFRSPYDYM